MCVLIFFTSFVFKMFSFLKNSAAYYHECTETSIKLEFSQHIFEKHPQNIKFRENPFGASPVVPRGQTDGQTCMKQLTVVLRKFCEGVF